MLPLEGVRNEISQLGWNGILQKYHPDVNVNREDAFRFFTFYKEVYEDMKFNTIQMEILKIGWNGILNKYHPDINMDVKSDATSWDIFQLYKEVYESIQRRVIIED
jgi:DnaJ-class molecular chaperone